QRAHAIQLVGRIRGRSTSECATVQELYGKGMAKTRNGEWTGNHAIVTGVWRCRPRTASCGCPADAISQPLSGLSNTPRLKPCSLREAVEQAGTARTYQIRLTATTRSMRGIP